MRNEIDIKIGGEFEINPISLEGYELYEDKNSPILFSSGRSALNAILQHLTKKGVNVIHVPFYICSSVVQACKNASFLIKFYELDSNFLFPLENFDSIRKGESLLSVNYFGLVDDNPILNIINNERPDIITISDHVQSLWTCKNSLADFSFTSLRKHLPIPDGSIVYHKGKVWKPNIKMPDNAFYNKKLLGAILKNNKVNDSLFLSFFEEGEKELDNEISITRASDISNYLYDTSKLELVKEKRKENYQLVYNLGMNAGFDFVFPYSPKQIPLCVPIRLNHRNEIKRKLMNSNIFLPVHWPISLYSSNSKLAQEMAGKGLSLVIDQRYSSEAMENQVNTIKKIES